MEEDKIFNIEEIPEVELTGLEDINTGLEDLELPEIKEDPYISMAENFIKITESEILFSKNSFNNGEHKKDYYKNKYKRKIKENKKQIVSFEEKIVKSEEVIKEHQKRIKQYERLKKAFIESNSLYEKELEEMK